MSTYLIINILVIIIPLLFSFDKKVAFFRTWKYFFPAMLTTGAFFLIWDIYFTHIGVWGFNEAHLMGINILNLPMEEWLFFITVPYAVVFSYRVLNAWAPMIEHPEMQRTVSYALLVLLIAGAVLYHDRLYSVVTFSLAAIFVLITEWFLKVYYLLHFYRAYLIALIPFLITNGVLTGFGLEEPVVWYNDSMNSGIRFITIPMEDTAYGFLLVGMNISFMEWFAPGKGSMPKFPGFKNKQKQRSKSH
ncbi:lycopene cyclase domain-containing protein [Marinilabilia rubra]|uniref:Lycopene cyclase domain-containing protein n=1 Tax=Marinilabilia rubra TaxID=2162893 RepID=A0A2U2B3M5_9BACT|nr:lycopene cyclase domain-containing protein [Marinilabilia rubra]PWD97660.1 lycopene cyclase domain-containing protein [Marinilabilia rubra]